MSDHVRQQRRRLRLELRVGVGGGDEDGKHEVGEQRLLRVDRFGALRRRALAALGHRHRRRVDRARSGIHLHPAARAGGGGGRGDEADEAGADEGERLRGERRALLRRRRLLEEGERARDGAVEREGERLGGAAVARAQQDGEGGGGASREASGSAE